MYSWTAVRAVAGTLLLVPLVHLVFLVSRDTLAVLDSVPTAWENEVRAYEAADLNSSLPREPLVVVGGELVSKWRGLEGMLAPLPVLNRGLGRATVNDITYYYRRLIGHYGPSAVVIVPGLSEFHLRDNKTPQQLVDAIRELAELNLAHEITRKVYVFAPLLTPRYPADAVRVEESTRLLALWTREIAAVNLLDANPLLAAANGNADPYYFHSDGTTLNQFGYFRMSLLLQKAVEADFNGR